MVFCPNSRCQEDAETRKLTRGPAAASRGHVVCAQEPFFQDQAFPPRIFRRGDGAASLKASFMMKNESLALADVPRSLSFSARDLLAIGFRRKRAIGRCFLGILMGAILAALLKPSEYTATTKFLVERERADPVVSPLQDAQATSREAVTEEELNSEVELLQGDDVLGKVVVACGLQRHKSFLTSRLGVQDEQKQIPNAFFRLRKDLKIQPIKKSNLIF